MTKIQKIWLGIFSAMFIVPEVLWSPVGNYIYAFLQTGGSFKYLHESILFNGKFDHLLSFVLSIELVSLVGILFIVLKYWRMNKLPKYLLLFVLLIIILLTLLSLYTSINLSMNIL